MDLQSSNAAGDSPAVIAARNGDGKCLRALRDCGIDVMRPSSSGVTPLQVAQSRNRSDVVRFLKVFVFEEEAGEAAKNAKLPLLADLDATDEMRTKTQQPRKSKKQKKGGKAEVAAQTTLDIGDSKAAPLGETLADNRSALVSGRKEKQVIIIRHPRTCTVA